MKKDILDRICVGYEERAYKSLIPSEYGGFKPDKGFEDWEEDINAVEKALAPKTFYLFSNKIYHDKDTLDDTLFEYYASDNKSVDRIEMLVAEAYEPTIGTVDTVELSYEEFIEHLKHYEFIGGS